MKIIWITHRSSTNFFREKLASTNLSLTISTNQTWQESIRSFTGDIVLLDIHPKLPLAKIVETFSGRHLFVIGLVANEQLTYGLQLLTTGLHDLWPATMSEDEMLLRLQGLSRYFDEDDEREVLSFNQGQLKIFQDSKQVFVGTSEVLLTSLEYAILYQLAIYPKRIYSRDELITLIKEVSNSTLRVVDTHIKNLRRKIESNPKHPLFIQTVHGRGYRFEGTKDMM